MTAAVLGHEEFTQVSPVVTFKLTPYIERYLNLWMIGGATVGGWSLDNATPMESIEDEPNGFVWEGVLLSGELKFVLRKLLLFLLLIRMVKMRINLYIGKVMTNRMRSL